MDGFSYRVLQLMYFMLPAYAANMAPPSTKYWKGSNPPIARRWLGAHKTVLGFASGVAAAVLVAFLQSHIAWSGSLVQGEPWLGLGLRFGVGALLMTWSRAPLSWRDCGLILCVSLAGDILVNHLSYWLGIRDTPW